MSCYFDHPRNCGHTRRLGRQQRSRCRAQRGAGEAKAAEDAREHHAGANGVGAKLPFGHNLLLSCELLGFAQDYAKLETHQKSFERIFYSSERKELSLHARKKDKHPWNVKHSISYIGPVRLPSIFVVPGSCGTHQLLLEKTTFTFWHRNKISEFVCFLNIFYRVDLSEENNHLMFRLFSMIFLSVEQNTGVVVPSPYASRVHPKHQAERFARSDPRCETRSWRSVLTSSMTCPVTVETNDQKLARSNWHKLTDS